MPIESSKFQRTFTNPPPLAWLVRSKSANYNALFMNHGHALDMVNSKLAPSDIELIPLVDGRVKEQSARTNC